MRLIQNVLTISMPTPASIFPAMPVLSHEGDHLQRIARVHRRSSAMATVEAAPEINASVTSSPVTWARKALSAHVVYTRPRERLTGGRGQPSPASSSGQTGTSVSRGCSWTQRLTKELADSLRPCQRHGSPIRQRDTSTFMGKVLSYIDFQSMENMCLVIGARYA